MGSARRIVASCARDTISLKKRGFVTCRPPGRSVMLSVMARLFRCRSIALAFAFTTFACGSSSSNPADLGDSGAGDDSGSSTDGVVYDGFNLDSGDGGCLPPCGSGLTCYKGTCIPVQPPCKSDNDCQNDSYCDKATSTCVPYGPPGKDHNPDCVSVVPIGLFAPAVYCEFRAAPAGDKFPTYLNVLATPVVGTFAAGELPSIVSPFYNGLDGSSEQDGILRVLSGKDCTQLAQLGEVGGSATIVSASSSPALGDLDGDGFPEIVAYSKPTPTTGSVIAFTKKAGAWSVLWRAHNLDTTPWTSGSGPHEWAGPSIHDLDDDGKPEVLREGWVFDHTGTLITRPPAGFSEGPYGVGQFPVVADLDGDGNVEMVNGLAVYRFDKATKTWTTAATVTGGVAGLTALADFGTDAVDGKFDGKGEIGVVSRGFVYVQTAKGATVWGPITLPGSAGGGPPTIADFDGDGQPEIAVAGSDSYTVIDPDCQAASVRPGGKCASKRTDGILWTKKSQDHSSNITGSSVFDFDADGIAEAIYSDECFARVYAGDTGDVIFSQYISSCTWYENPIVADVNNDDRAELITVGNLNCGPDATSGRACEAGEVEYPDPARPTVPVDAIFAGLRCKAPTDCLSGVCDSGFCRCTADAQCCLGKTDASCMETGFICMPPPAGTPGTGKTCRAAHPHGIAGIRVYHDFADRWVKSRNIWNQHAYSITNVNDDGTIPKTSAWTANWKHVGPTYNDFRKNTPGTADPLKSPDLTAKGSSMTCTSGTLTLSVQVCNRGAEKASGDYTVTFYEGDTADPTKVICTAKTTKPLDVAECEILSCVWKTPPKTTPEDVYILIDAEGHTRNCNSGNKSSMIKGVVCAGPA